jgi:hypothetical protein
MPYLRVRNHVTQIMLGSRKYTACCREFDFRPAPMLQRHSLYNIATKIGAYNLNSALPNHYVSELSVLFSALFKYFLGRLNNNGCFKLNGIWELVCKNRKMIRDAVFDISR